MDLINLFEKKFISLQLMLRMFQHTRSEEFRIKLMTKLKDNPGPYQGFFVCGGKLHKPSQGSLYTDRVSSQTLCQIPGGATAPPPPYPLAMYGPVTSIKGAVSRGFCCFRWILCWNHFDALFINHNQTASVKLRQRYQMNFIRQD